MKKLILTILLFLTPTVSLAETNLGLKMGFGVTNNLQSSYYQFEVENFFQKNYYYKNSLGFWTDQQPEHTPAFTSSFLLGRRFGNYNGFHVSLGVGFGVISSTDILLSTPFQFTEELNIGYDKFSIGCQHFSNAGIKLPNMGRDYCYFRTVIRW